METSESCGDNSFDGGVLGPTGGRNIVPPMKVIVINQDWMAYLRNIVTARGAAWNVSSSQRCPKKNAITRASTEYWP